ncbi:DNA repair protein RecO [bacterium]|nr:DNA repair protein RecO [bacterium]
MCTVTCDGFLLRVAGFGDFDARVTIFSQDYGKLNLVAKRLNRPGRLRGQLLTFSLCDLQIKKNRNSNLLILEDCERLLSFPAFSKDIRKLACASCITEVLLRAVPERSPSPELFELLSDSLRQISKSRSPEAMVIAAQLHLLRSLGIGPSFAECVSCGKPIKISPTRFNIEAGGFVCPNCQAGKEPDGQPWTAVKLSRGAISFCRMALHKPIRSLGSISISAALRRELLRFMFLYFAHHLQVELNSARMLGQYLNRHGKKRRNI